ncbi:hypothetical protein [Lysinibacillus pakistanensis]|uniref:hypothetical protein n=1 Tax=Lysinibacillus pakistanensis TaxID=759811 RepID=UPI003F73A9FD
MSTVYTRLWAISSLYGVTGLAMPIFNTPATGLLQEKVEGDFLGEFPVYLE